MDDWTYCRETLPKVSRTFALNISVLRGELYRSILTAYLFCRTVDTIEDAARLDPQIKIRLLHQFAELIQDPDYRGAQLKSWIQDCSHVDGATNDLDLLSQINRVFNIFDLLQENYQKQIIPSVSTMARGMAYFQKGFNFDQFSLLENEDELEEYCYFVAGTVGEMLCNLFLQEMPGLSSESETVMKQTAVSFGLGLQMTNISKDVVVDRGRGWSYIPKSFITGNGLTVEEFNEGARVDKNMKVLEKLLHKTVGHLQDSLRFTIAIPRHHICIRLFCIWPLWMAMETVAVLHNNESLLKSDDPVKISRKTVKRILRNTPWYACSNRLLQSAFDNILRTGELNHPPRFSLENLKQRLSRLSWEQPVRMRMRSDSL